VEKGYRVIMFDRRGYGQSEKGTDFEAVEFYRHLPQGELAILPRCGHNTYEEQPEEYIRFVLNFLKRHHF
jgi:pimeloyl-ACP methyl ester carboxylesterase